MRQSCRSERAASRGMGLTRRSLLLLAATTVGLGLVPMSQASAAPVVTFSISGTATATCPATDFGGCLPGTTTTTALSGTVTNCVGTSCPTTDGVLSASYGFVRYPPNPCKASKLSGSLTLEFPTDPVYPPNPWTVLLSGHVRDSKSVVLTGTVPPDTGFPPTPVKVTVITAFPPNPCAPNAGSFTGTIAIG